MKNNLNYYADDCCYGQDYRRYYRTAVLFKWANTAKEKAEKQQKPNPASDIFSVLCEHFDPDNNSVNLNSKSVFFLFRRIFINLGYKTVIEAQKDNEELYTLFWSSTVAFLEELISHNMKLDYLKKLNDINTPFDFATDIVGSYVKSNTFLTKISSDDTWSYLLQKIRWVISTQIENSETIVSTLSKKERQELKRNKKDTVFDDDEDDEKEKIPIFYHTSIDSPAYDDDSDTTVGEIIASDKNESDKNINESFGRTKNTEFFKHLSTADIVVCCLLKEGRLRKGYRNFLEKAYDHSESEEEVFKYILKESCYISDEHIELLIKQTDLSSLKAMTKWSANTYTAHAKKLKTDHNFEWLRNDDNLVYTHAEKERKRCKK